jgi:hypothetical protein
MLCSSLLIQSFLKRDFPRYRVFPAPMEVDPVKVEAGVAAVDASSPPGEVERLNFFASRVSMFGEDRFRNVRVRGYTIRVHPFCIGKSGILTGRV